MNRLLVVLIVVGALFLAGQWYLRFRRRKAAALFERLARQLVVARRGIRLELLVGSHRVVVDAQVTSDDRPEELRLALETGMPGEFRLTGPVAASHYQDCKHREPSVEGAPFAGWHVHSEDPAQLVALSADSRAHASLERLAELGFTRIELEKGKLRACWPEFPWELDRHTWEAGQPGSIPIVVRRAAEKLSDVATAAETASQLTGRAIRGTRVRVMRQTLFAIPLFVMLAGVVGIIFLYPKYSTLRDGQLVLAMVLAGVMLATFYTGIAWFLLRKSVQRSAHTALAGLVSFFGFALGSAAPILWWNGTGSQAPGERLTAQVIRQQQHSGLDSAKGEVLRFVIGRESPIEEWFKTYRAIVQSWRDDSIYAITLSAEQFFALPPDSATVSFILSPGALGLEWYSAVAIVSSPRDEARDAEPPRSLLKN